MTREELELTILTEVSRTLGSTLNLKDVFSEIMTTLANRLEMKRGTLVLLDSGTGLLSIEAAHGLTAEETKRGRYRVGEGITGRVVQTGGAIVIDDIRKEPQFLDRTRARSRLLQEGHTISFICVPVKMEKMVVGALSVDKIFTDARTLSADERLLTIIASIVAQAIKINQMVILEKEELAREVRALRSELVSKYRFDNIVGVSSAMQRIFEMTAAVAGSRASVLLMGETGTGKELIAKAIHYNSPRKDKPFVRVNCGALSEGLLESELFGHVRGSFTGAISDKKGKFKVADGGTLFLDEVSNMSDRLQMKLLRVLQEREFERVGDTRTIHVDVRIIAASNKDLEKEVEAGRFREDLFYRLNVVPIYLPPLRERREDIPLLIEYFLDKYNEENDKNVHKISKSVLDLLMRYPWRGNVRELENCVEKVVVLSQGEEFSDKHLPINIKIFQKEHGEAGLEEGESLDKLAEKIANLGFKAPADGKSIHKRVMGEIEKKLIEKALAESGQKKIKAARLLGINRNTLHKKIKDISVKAK